MGSVFAFLGPTMVLLLLVLVALGMIAFGRGQLTFPTVVHVYTASLLGVCLILTLSGGALLVTSLTSTAIARDFSYQTVDFPRSLPPGVPEPPLPSAAERAQTQAEDDLTAGITLLVIGGGLGIPHAIANGIARRRDMYAGAAIEQGRSVMLLAVGTVVGLGSCVSLLNDTLRRYVVTAAPTPYNQPHPGGALGLALMFVPLWVCSAYRVWHTLAPLSVPMVHTPVEATQSETRPS